MEKRFDTVIRGGTVVSGQGTVAADIGINDGRIEVVGSNIAEASAARVIDASGQYVLPGVVDAHSHPVYDDGFEATSAGGLLGGVTTLVAYAGPNPAWGRTPNSLTESIERFLEEARKTSLTDFSLHGVVLRHDDVAPQVGNLIGMGIISFKFFMAYKKRGMMVEDYQILRVMDAVAENGGIAMVHAESGAAIDYMTDKYSAMSPVTNDLFTQVHRDLLEAEAIFRAVALAEAVNCPLYVDHVAVKEGVEVVRPLKYRLRMPLFLETCPHYLILTNEEVLRRGPLAKIGPPIRERHDNEALWEGLRDGTIDVMATDHCGIKAETKMSAAHILEARFGAPGVQYLLPLTFSEGVRKGRISLARMVQVLCENPAKIFGLFPRKGTLSPGSDADVVILDPEKRQICSAETQVSKAGYCLYEGRETVGTPSIVLQRGRVLVENGSLLARPGDGRFLPGRNPIWT